MKEPDGDKMISWYSPKELVKTGSDAIISTIFAWHADRRRLDAINQTNLPDYSYSSDDDFWFDFIADCGDGWNPTYAVAYTRMQDQLYLEVPKRSWQGPPVPLKRGSLLVFGGDLVYPTPSHETYDRRFVRPYADAAGTNIGFGGDVLAIPGNHDWYDSLVAFRRIFCSNTQFAGLQTHQRRSYFAAQLPGHWWIFGVDLQLVHDIDEGQLKYFSDLIDKKMGEDDKIIMCYPEPIWLMEWYQDKSKLTQTLIETLEEKAAEKIRVQIAGDLHHYRRHISTANVHRITCGTGGAFLHPTHERSRKEKDDSERVEEYPSTCTSRLLSLRNIFFLPCNLSFGVVTAFAYLLIAWQNGIYVGEEFGSIKIDQIGNLGRDQYVDAFFAGVQSAFLSPLGMALYAIIVFGFVFFADSSSKIFRYVAGLSHAGTHIVAGFLVYWLGAYVAITFFELTPKSISQYFLTGLIIFVAGWIVGSIILGFYLLISILIFGKHNTVAFSSLKIQDWKGFLRCRILPNGKLELYFIGLRHVPRRWKCNCSGGGSKWIPRDEGASSPSVVDYFEA